MMRAGRSTIALVLRPSTIPAGAEVRKRMPGVKRRLPNWPELDPATGFFSNSGNQTHIRLELSSSSDIGSAVSLRAPYFPGSDSGRLLLLLVIHSMFGITQCRVQFHPSLLKEQCIWTIQQARGDVLGRHACVSITNEEAEFIIRLLEASNPIYGPTINYAAERSKAGLTSIKKKNLPIDLKINSPTTTPMPGRLHYEASLESLLMQELCHGSHRDVFGDFTEVIPFVSTGAQTELDLLLSKHDQSKLLWYQVIELKARTFSEEELAGK